MEVPILKQGEILIATVQAVLTNSDLLELRRALVEKVAEARARGIIIDLTAMDVMDSLHHARCGKWRI